MNERQRRGRDFEREDYRDSRRSDQGPYGRDEPWREERRYSDEPYSDERNRQFGERPYRDYDDRGFERGRSRSDRTRDQGGFETYGESPGGRSDFGHGYGYGFGDSSDYRAERYPNRTWEDYPRADDRGWGGRREMSARGGETWNRGRTSGGFGSEYGAWSSGATSGFGPAESPGRTGRGGFEESDWALNRPTRGQGTWAVDSSVGRASGGYGAGSPRGSSYASDWAARTNYAGASYARENFAGRGPKDYRRSDDRIREDISDRFTDDPDLDPSEVQIKVENCDVILMGTVTNREQKRRAEELAERVSGVKEVINQIRVSRGDTFQTSGTSQQPQQQPGSRGARSSTGSQPPSVAADKEGRS